jgi:hypothetical protein
MRGSLSSGFFWCAPEQLESLSSSASNNSKTRFLKLFEEV